MTYRALCNDCGRGHNFKTGAERMAAHVGDTPCVCGGTDICCCNGCLRSLEKLESGFRGDPTEAGFMPGVVLAGWTAENGLVL